MIAPDPLRARLAALIERWREATTNPHLSDDYQQAAGFHAEQLDEILRVVPAAAPPEDETDSDFLDRLQRQNQELRTLKERAAAPREENDEVTRLRHAITLLTTQNQQYEWVLEKAEELVREHHGKDAAQLFTDAWGELPKELTGPPAAARRAEWHPIATCPADGLFLVYQDGAIRLLYRSRGEWQTTAKTRRIRARDTGVYEPELWRPIDDLLEAAARPPTPPEGR